MKTVKIARYKNLPEFIKPIFRFEKQWLYVVEYNHQTYATRVYPLTVINFVPVICSILRN